MVLLLAKTTGIDKGTVSRSVNRLTKSELIQLGELHANGRLCGLTLSPQGRMLHDRIHTVALGQQAHLFDGFSPS